LYIAQKNEAASGLLPRLVSSYTPTLC